MTSSSERRTLADIIDTTPATTEPEQDREPDWMRLQWGEPGDDGQCAQVAHVQRDTRQPEGGWL